MNDALNTFVSGTNGLIFQELYFQVAKQIMEAMSATNKIQ